MILPYNTNDNNNNSINNDFPHIWAGFLQSVWLPLSSTSSCVIVIVCVCVCARCWVRGVQPMPIPPLNHPQSHAHTHTHTHRTYTPLSSQSYRWCAVQLHFHHCDDECSCQTPGNQSHICSCLCRHGHTAEVCTTTSTRPGGNNGWHRKENERGRGRERESRL